MAKRKAKDTMATEKPTTATTMKYSRSLPIPRAETIIYTPETPDQDDRTFPQFGKLAPEIRNLIWSLAPMPQRTIVVSSHFESHKVADIFTMPPKTGDDQEKSAAVKDRGVATVAARVTRSQLAAANGNATNKGRAIPIVLRVCHESRQVGLKHYGLLFDNPNLNLPNNAYIDYETDSLAFWGEKALPNFCAVADMDRSSFYDLTNDFMQIPQTRNTAQKELKNLRFPLGSLRTLQFELLARFQKVETLVVREDDPYNRLSNAAAREKEKKMLETWKKGALEWGYDFKKPKLEELAYIGGLKGYMPDWTQ